MKNGKYQKEKKGKKRRRKAKQETEQEERITGIRTEDWKIHYRRK